MTDLAPTLGPQVAHFINTNGVHGPGDVMGERFELSFEELGFLYRAYELTEDEFRPGRWRRQFRQGVYCRRKGLRKSEFMAQVTLAEFDGPVRFSGRWAKGGEVDEWGYVFEPGEPMGERVTAPEIPVVATTADQAEKLVWGVIRYVFENTPLASRYNVQEDRIFFVGRQKEEGWAYLIPPTNSKAADGAKPTFVPREEAHIWTSADLKRTARVMGRNLVKRQAADPWTMDATTTFGPGENSVLESSLKSSAADPSVLIDQRSASEHWNLEDREQWLKAVEEASGDAWEWTNIAGIWSEWVDPEETEADFRRFQLNQARAVSNRPFSGEKWDVFAAPERTPGPSKRVPLAVLLHGSKTRGATSIICWTLDERPHLFLAGHWEREDASLREEWSVPEGEVKARLLELAEDFTLVLLGGDRDKAWGPYLVDREDDWGKERVVHFPTQRGKLVDTAIERFESEWNVGLARAAEGGETPWTHDGSPELRQHMSNLVVVKRAGSQLRSLGAAGEGQGQNVQAGVAAVCGFALVPAGLVKAAEMMTPRSAGIL